MKIDESIQNQYDEIDRKARNHFLQHHIDMLKDNIKYYFPEDAEHIIISVAEGYNCPLYAIDVHYVINSNEIKKSATERLILQQYNANECCFCTTYVQDVPQKYAKYSYMAGFIPKLLKNEYILE